MKFYCPRTLFVHLFYHGQQVVQNTPGLLQCTKKNQVSFIGMLNVSKETFDLCRILSQQNLEACNNWSFF
jgi:hypothetical protein